MTCTKNLDMHVYSFFLHKYIINSYILLYLCVYNIYTYVYVDIRKKTCKLLRDNQFLLQSRLCIWTEVTHQRSITPQTSMSAKLWFHENLNGFLRKMIECLRNLRPHHPPEKGEEGIHISKWIYPPTSTISAMVILITSPGEKSPRLTWGEIQSDWNQRNIPKKMVSYCHTKSYAY